MSSGGHGQQGTVDVLRKGTLLVLLTLAMLGIHQFALPPEGFEVRGLFALGYIILAAYTIGELAEVVRLPHITGYLLAGLALGPSVAHLLHGLHLPPPLDQGILNQQVIDQLVLLDSLALALIALTAGGELKLQELREGIRSILGVLVGQAVTIAFGVVLFLVLALSVAPQLLPPVSSAGTGVILALGAVVASVAFATSPAATIAVINSTGARGPLAKTVLSSVILKDVLVVVAFSACTAMATGVMGLATDGGFLLSLWHIAQSILLGVAVGGLLHLYLRFVGAELLLFLVAAIYTTTFVAEQIHAEAALVFIVAGIVVSNFSDRGETLIHEVERLSMPVYVVFFTLAGAKLHLDELWAMLPLALGLVLVRVAALFVGVRAGARLAGAPPVVAQYGWMGFVSQAGLAITLATQVKATYPNGVGEALFSVLLGGVAINEMAGPVLLQLGLGFARETHGTDTTPEKTAAEATGPASEPVPDDLDLGDPFGPPLDTGVEPLDRAVDTLQADLQSLVRERTWGPMMDLRRDAESWLKQLRRDLLRVQRAAMGKVASEEVDQELATALRYQVGELSDRWRQHVLNLAARLPRSDRWSPADVLEGVDAHVNSLQVNLTSPILPSSLVARDESGLRSAQRALLRVRARLRGEREIHLRDLARYHLSGAVPARLEGVAALMVDSELHLASQVQSVFEGLAADGEEAARLAEVGRPRDEVRQILERSREEADEALDELNEQLEAVAREGVARAAAVVGWGVRRLKDDVQRIGTFELPYHQRRFSRVFAQRNRGIASLGPGLHEARRLVAARYAQLALELELVGLEGRVQDAVQSHGTHLERLVRGRGPKQLQLVEQALAEWLKKANGLLDQADQPGDLMRALRAETEPVVRRIQEARRAVEQLHHELSDEGWLAPLLDHLHTQVQGLTDFYMVPTQRLTSGSWSLPAPTGTTEVPFQQLATGAIDSGITRDLLDLTGTLAEQVQGLQTLLDELERVLVFNVDLALAELDVLEEDAPFGNEVRELVRAMLTGAVGRSHARLQKTVVTASEAADGVREGVRNAVIGRFQRMHQLLLDGHLAQLRLEVLRDGALRRGLVQRAGQWTALPDLRDVARRVVERTVGSERLEIARDALGLPNARDGEDLRSLLAAPPPAESVPVVYRRLFSDQALEGADLLSGRHDALQKIRQVLTEPTRRLRSVAVVSVDPHAARALVNTALRSHTGGVARLQADHLLSDVEVEAFLAELPAKDVCVVVEDLVWLYRRTPAGTAPIDRIARAVVADAGKRAWVFLADPAVWAWVSEATSLDEGTGEVLHLGPLSPSDLQAAVLARHTMSGYEASFGDDEDLPLLSRLLRRRDREQRKQREWFDNLHEASAGVLQDALNLWMAAIDGIDEERGSLHLGAVPRPPVARLAELPDDTLLTLVQVLRQGWIDAEQHAWLFRTDTAHAEAHLAQLVNQGLLREEGPCCVIVPHLRGALERALRQRGWST